MSKKQKLQEKFDEERKKLFEQKNPEQEEIAQEKKPKKKFIKPKEELTGKEIDAILEEKEKLRIQ